MKQKDFSTGLKDVLGSTKKKTTKAKAAPKKTETASPLKKKKETRGRKPNPNPRVLTKTSQKGTKAGESRATYILKEELIEKLKDLAYWEREALKDVVGEVLTKYVADYEKKKGKIKPRPVKK